MDLKHNITDKENIEDNLVSWINVLKLLWKWIKSSYYQSNTNSAKSLETLQDESAMQVACEEVGSLNRFEDAKEFENKKEVGE